MKILGQEITLIGPKLALGLAVTIAAIGSFFLPSKLFIFINIEQTEINRLQELISDDQLALSQSKDIEAKLQIGLQNVAAELDATEEQLFQQSGRIPESFGLHSPRLAQLPPAFESAEDELRYKLRISENDLSEIRSRSEEYLNAMERTVSEIESIRKRRREIVDRKGEIVLKLTQTTNTIADLTNRITVNQKTIDQLMKDSEHQYFAVRAFALGAMGAFAAAMSLHLASGSASVGIRPTRATLSMLFGGIVSLVVFGLFTTREISVFSNTTLQPDAAPDYWRTVILCLVAGAFADRIFAAAQQRVDDFTQLREELKELRTHTQPQGGRGG